MGIENRGLSPVLRFCWFCLLGFPHKFLAGFSACYYINSLLHSKDSITPGAFDCSHHDTTFSRK